MAYEVLGEIHAAEARVDAPYASAIRKEFRVRAEEALVWFYLLPGTPRRARERR